MTREVGPVPPVGPRDRRETERRNAADRRAAAQGGKGPASASTLPVRVQETIEPAHPAEDHAPLDPAAAFAAQLIGQSGQKRGLKGGPPVLDQARSTYLGAEYSGDKDRRPPAGVVKKTEV